MAKKKLNRRFAAAVVTTTIVVAGGGALSFKYLYNSVRPQQRKAEGRAAMERGDYQAAFGSFAGVGSRLSGDAEFMTWLYQTQIHLTSFDESHYVQSRGRLDAITNIDPSNKFALAEKLRMDLQWIDRAGIEQSAGAMGRRIADAAARLLEIDPGNRVALRGQAVAKIAPFFEAAALPTSADVQAARDAIAAMLDGPAPADGDLTLRYVQASARLRDALVRERAIASDADPRARAIGDEVDARIATLVGTFAAPATRPGAVAEAADAAGQPTSRPAAELATAALRAAYADEVARPVLGTARLGASVARSAASLARAVALATPAEPDAFLQARLAYGALLTATNRADEAERVLRGLVDGLPLQWTPRLALAGHLADRGRAAEAVELLKTELKPSTDLLGLEGMLFTREAQAVPIQRAFFRLQGVSALPVGQRDAAIDAAKADYDLAVSRTGEGDPRVMQVKAGLQEVRQDRTGAIQTLTQALNAGPGEALRIKMMEQLVNLNLALRQTGAAAEILDQIWERSKSPLTLLRLIELNARNGRNEAARTLLDEAKLKLPGNPAVAALEVRLMATPAERQAALGRMTEDEPALAIVKIKLAAEAGEVGIARQVADRSIAKFPDNIELKAAYAEVLLRAGDRAGATTVLEAIAKARPDDKTVSYLLDSARAETPDQRQQLANTFVEENVTDPYKRALVDAERARVKDDEPTFLAKLEEADKLDAQKTGDAAERLFIYALARGKLDDAERYLTSFAASKRDPAQVRVARVRLLLGRLQFDAALQQANAITAELPTFSGGWQVKAIAHASLGQFAEAVKAYDAALAAEPNNIGIVRAALESADRAGQRDVLRRLIDQGLAMEPGDPLLADWSLRYEAAYGDAAKTIAPRVQMRDAQPDQPNAWLALIGAYVGAANQRATANDARGAGELRQKAIDVAKEAAAKFPAIAAFPLETTKLLAQAGDRAGADAVAAKVAADPTLGVDPAVQVALAGYYVDRGQAAAAIAMYDKAIAGGKAGDDVKIRVAQLRAGGNDFAGALATLDGVADSPVTRELRVNVLFAAGRGDDAKAIADAALAKERSAPNLLLGALVASRRADEASARKLVEEAVGVEPENPAARFSRARLALAAPPVKNEDVVADLQVVRKVAPGNVEARLLLVDRLDAGGRSDESRAELEALQRDAAGNAAVATRLVLRLAGDRPVPQARIDDVLDRAKRQSPNDVQLLSLEAGVALDRGDQARAIAAARAASTAAGPQDVNMYRRLLSTMVRAAAADRALAELDARKAEFETAYWSHLTRGVALHRMKRDAEAKPAFDRAIELAASMVEDGPLDEVAQTYATEYDVDAAAAWLRAKLPAGPRQQALVVHAFVSRQAYDKAIAAAAGLVEAADELRPVTRTIALADVGAAALGTTPPRAAVARAAFEKLLALDPSHAMTANNLAYAMTLEGSGATPRQAADLAKRAYDQANATGRQQSAYIGDTYGWTLVLAGEVDEGLTVLRKARQTEALPEIDLHIGEALLRQNQADGAKAAFQTALANIEKLKQNQRPVDPSLVGRLNEALARAGAAVP